MHERGIFDRAELVVIDVSALPANIYFPLVGSLLTAAQGGQFAGNLQVVVCENPELDSAILAEGVRDPAPISGFISGLTQDSQPSEVRVWAPVVGEGQGAQLEAIHQYLIPVKSARFYRFRPVIPDEQTPLLSSIASCSSTGWRSNPETSSMRTKLNPLMFTEHCAD
jgi:hypothetical protein